MKLPPGFVPGLGVVAPTARGGLGERLLRRFGWDDGQGLGKDAQGRADAVTVAMKANLAGVRMRGGRERGGAGRGGAGRGRRPMRPTAASPVLTLPHTPFLSLPPCL